MKAGGPGPFRPPSAFRALAVASLLIAVTGLSAAPVAPQKSVEFERRILAFYDSDDEATPLKNHIQRAAEMPLNYLGLKVEYHDIAKGVPSAERMKRYRGIVIWTVSWEMRRAEEFWIWLGDQIRGGKKVVFMNGPVPRSDRETRKPVSLSVINGTLNLMGLEAGGQASKVPMDIEVLEKDPAMVEFERPLGYELDFFSELVSIDDRNRVYLRLKLKPTAALSDAVVVTPWGGIVMAGYATYQHADLIKSQWRLNPFRFFAEAFGVTDSPRPDWTTMNGTRLFYSHIDGDGFISRIKKKEDRICGEELYDEVLSRYPQLPITVSVIVVEVEKKTRGGPRSIDAAKKIFALSNIEPASHTYAHPLIWDLKLTGPEGFLPYKDKFKREDIKDDILMPWRISGYHFDPAREIVFSSQYIESVLLPPEKKVRLIQWSGNCRPNRTAMAVAANAGLLNINGGDSRFDGEFPSYIYIAPLYRKEGPYYQIHSSNANENVYTEDWSTNFGGFQNVIQTFERTESPRRVAPVNIYYHFYSAEEEAALYAVNKAYSWAIGSDIFPIFTSRFVEIAGGFISTRIRRDNDAWLITDNGECRTMRFDNTTSFPDMKRSEGILGFHHFQGSLYVSLDDSDRHRIVLSESPPREKYLEKSSAYVNEYSAVNDTFTFRTNVTKAPYFIWRNLPAAREYSVTIVAADQQRSLNVTTDEAGTLELRFELYGDAVITVAPAGRK